MWRESLWTYRNRANDLISSVVISNWFTPNIGGMEIRTSGDIYDQETETEHKSVAIKFFKPVLTLRYAINKH